MMQTSSSNISRDELSAVRTLQNAWRGKTTRKVLNLFWGISVSMEQIESAA
jgi:hypothetical protein